MICRNFFLLEQQCVCVCVCVLYNAAMNGRFDGIYVACVGTAIVYVCYTVLLSVNFEMFYYWFVFL